MLSPCILGHQSTPTTVLGSVLETTGFAPIPVPTVGSAAVVECVAVEAVLWRITPAAVECVAVVAASWMITPASVEIAASVCPTMVVCTPGSPALSPLRVDTVIETAASDSDPAVTALLGVAGLTLPAPALFGVLKADVGVVVCTPPLRVDTVASTAAPDPDPDSVVTALLELAGLGLPASALPVVLEADAGVVACPPASVLVVSVIVLARVTPRADAMYEATPAPAELVVGVPDSVSTAFVVDVRPGVELETSTCSLLPVLPSPPVEEDDASLSGVMLALPASA